MEPAFFSCIITQPRKPLPYPVHVEFPPADGSEIDFFDEKGTRHVSFKMPEGDAHHIALGKFADEWAKLEGTLFQIFKRLLGFNSSMLFHAVFNAVGNRGAYDAITALAHSLQNEGLRNRLLRQLETFKSLNTKRNHYFHGEWCVSVLPKKDGDGVKLIVDLVRLYNPSNPVEFTALSYERSQKERSKYMTSLVEMGRVTDRVRDLRRAFVETMSDPEFDDKRDIVDKPV
jgi:hypothetical protein